MSQAIALNSRPNVCQRIQDSVESLRHGKKAMILTALTVVASVAAPIFAALLIAGWTAAAAPTIIFSAVVVASSLLFGSKLFKNYMPDLCKMIIGFMRGQPVIQPNGAWKGERVAHAHFFDKPLSQELCKFFQEERADGVADFGCGTGEYVKLLRGSGIRSDGFDGNPDTPAISKNTCQVQDLGVPFRSPAGYDWVMSLEVGEHLPKELESVFIDNLMANARKGVVLSWAKKGQGGHGHVNEQNNDYIKRIFQQKGWVNDLAAEKRLRCASYPIYFWYYDTVMVFRKPA